MKKVGIVGIGSVAIKAHIPAWRRIKGTEIVAIADKNLSKARKVAMKYNIEHVYENYEELLDSDPLDIVDVCTPPYLHAEIAKEALGHGLHVLVEKPLALNYQDAKQICELAARNSRVVCPVYNYRFAESLITANGIINRGCLGKVLSVQVTYHAKNIPTISYLATSSQSGGVLYESGPHALDVLLRFVSDMRCSYAIGCIFPAAVGFRTRIFAVLLSSKGHVGTIDLAWMSAKSRFEVIVRGSAGDMTVDIANNAIVTEHGSDNIVTTEMRRLRNLLRIGVSVELGRYLKKQLEPHYLFIRKFADSILTGSTPPVRTDEILQIASLLESIRERVNQKHDHDYHPDNTLTSNRSLQWKE